ncbi:MAG: GNAT family N-acetyltransferase [Pseudomonadota bacterium]
MSVPATIETERLILTPIAPEDFAPWPAFYASDRARFIGGSLDPAQTWFKHAQLCGIALMGGGQGHWSVRARDGAYLGRVGLEQAHGWPEMELGWTFLAEASGKGYATEAGGALRDWALGTLGLASLVSFIDEANAPSQAVARRLGAAPDPAAFAGYPGCVAWRHPVAGGAA